MSVENNFQPLYKEINRHGWSLVYNPEFENYRERYKNIVSKVKGVLEGGDVEGVEVRRIKTKLNREYFLLRIGIDEFFIKKIKNSLEGGVSEFKAIQEAKNRLLKAGIKNVTIIDYIFALNHDDVKYSVSIFNKDLEDVLRLHMNELSVDGDYKEYARLDNRVLEIKTLLSDYRDVTSGNMGYDKETDMITLFDLNLKKDSLIESSDDEL